MKIIAENPAEEALLWRIKALSDELLIKIIDVLACRYGQF